MTSCLEREKKGLFLASPWGGAMVFRIADFETDCFSFQPGLTRAWSECSEPMEQSLRTGYLGGFLEAG